MTLIWAVMLQAEHQAQAAKQEQLVASLTALRDDSQQGNSPGAIARKAAAHQASAEALLQKVLAQLPLCCSVQPAGLSFICILGKGVSADIRHCRSVQTSCCNLSSTD